MSTSTKAGILGTLGVLAILGLPLLDPLTRARFVNGIVIEWGFPLLLLAVIAIAVAALYALGKEHPVAAVAIVVSGLIGMIGYSTARNYDTALEYAATVHEANDPMLISVGPPRRSFVVTLPLYSVQVHQSKWGNQCSSNVQPGFLRPAYLWP